MDQLIKRISTSIILLCILYLSINNHLILVCLLIIIGYFVMNESFFIFKKIANKNKLFLFLTTLITLFYTVFFLLIIYQYLIPFDVKYKSYLIFILIICISTDVGGYVFGKIIGGKKLTSISPNKTYSGMLGSFIFAFFFSYLFINFNKKILLFDLNFYIIILVVSFVSQAGDLTISFFKRKAKIKDTGTILPGHGGLLDRIDGIMFALPVGIILISI